VTAPPARAWKPRAGRSKAVVHSEQNKAAGGNHRRAIRLETGGIAVGSVVLKALKRDGKVHAYLRWTVDGRQVSRSLGPVSNATRKSNLADGWDLARSQGLVHDQPLPPESWASSPEVRSSMQGNRGRDTTPERRLRALLHARGLRYRVSVRPVPELRRTADIVFPKARIAVFVDGCYWHGCPEHYRPATKNSGFWWTKISENRKRDEDTNQALAAYGWTVIRCWEHEDPESAANHVTSVLDETL